MARPLRINVAGLTYHVTARGTNKMPIYLDDEDRLVFLDRLAEVADDCRLQCHAYCLMDNHYHLVVKTLDANLSRAIQRLNGPYGRSWNRRHGRVGHVFQDRFGAQVIQDETYLLTACRYVALNPVRAGLVRAPGDWPWSSYRATAGLDPAPTFLKPDVVWALLGGGPPAEAAARYRRFVSATDQAGALPRSLVLGDEAFVARFTPVRNAAPREVCSDHRDTRPGLERLFHGAFTRAARCARAAEALATGYRVVEVARHLDVRPNTVRYMVASASRSRVRRAGSEHRESTASRSDPDDSARTDRF